MKAKITRPDGTLIEVEGTPEEIAKLLPEPAPKPVTAAPPETLGEISKEAMEEIVRRLIPETPVWPYCPPNPWWDRYREVSPVPGWPRPQGVPLYPGGSTAPPWSPPTVWWRVVPPTFTTDRTVFTDEPDASSRSYTARNGQQAVVLMDPSTNTA